MDDNIQYNCAPITTRRNAISESNEDKLSEKIIDAIWNKDFEAFKEYFAQGISIYYNKAYPNTLVHYSNNVLLDILCYTIADIDERYDDITKMLELVLLHQADPNIDTIENTALQHFIYMNNPDAVKLLIQYGADIEKSTCINPSSPLRLASTLGCKEIVEILVRNNANSNTCNEYITTTLSHDISDLFKISTFFHSNDSQEKLKLANQLLTSNQVGIFLELIFTNSNDLFVFNDIIIPLSMQAIASQHTEYNVIGAVTSSYDCIEMFE
ncbi:ankyrin repeat domain-containing protein [Rickettsia sp. TH2014]|uniref:ankyrin repeat domain-containing protein n=1 Tax=Rickettsia sp. TH2014 TaxID=1967503 RepID=UPI001C46E692|nr:ankyrin repeat domain-containing protein [Rickettsia sp. TH2014]